MRVPRESRADEYVDLVINEMLPRVASEKLAEFCDVFCERGYFDIEQSRKILTAARKHGLKLRIHADQLTNSGAAQLAAELEAITADHLEKTDENGIAAMKSLRRTAGFAAGICVCAWIDMLPPSARNDRGWAGRRHCDGF